MNETEHYDIAKAIAAQNKITKEYGLSSPFAPTDGRCYRCKRNIYDVGGISVEKASKQIITGCPFCHLTYCE